MQDNSSSLVTTEPGKVLTCTHCIGMHSVLVYPLIEHTTTEPRSSSPTSAGHTTPTGKLCTVCTRGGTIPRLGH